MKINNNEITEQLSQVVRDLESKFTEGYFIIGFATDEYLTITHCLPEGSESPSRELIEYVDSTFSNPENVSIGSTYKKSLGVVNND